MKKNGFYLNIVFLGDEGVGKSKYLNSFLNNKLVNMEDSLIGINMEEKEYSINYKQEGILNLIDTAGQDKFKGITKKTNLYTLFVFDSDNNMYDVVYRKPFESLTKYILPKDP